MVASKQVMSQDLAGFFAPMGKGRTAGHRGMLRAADPITRNQLKGMGAK